MNEIPAEPGGAARIKYRWPWFLAAAVLLGVVLAVIWMSVAVQRTRRMRHLDSPPGDTDPRRASATRLPVSSSRGPLLVQYPPFLSATFS